MLSRQLRQVPNLLRTGGFARAHAVQPPCNGHRTCFKSTRARGFTSLVEGSHQWVPEPRNQNPHHRQSSKLFIGRRCSTRARKSRDWEARYPVYSPSTIATDLKEFRTQYSQVLAVTCPPPAVPPLAPAPTSFRHPPLLPVVL